MRKEEGKIAGISEKNKEGKERRRKCGSRGKRNRSGSEKRRVRDGNKRRQGAREMGGRRREEWQTQRLKGEKE